MKNQRTQSLLIILFGFVLLIGLLGFFFLPFAKKQDTGGPDVTLFIGVAAIIGAIALSGKTLTPRRVSDSEVEYPQIDQYQTNMLVCMAMAELGALLGVFVEQSRLYGYVMVGASLFAALFVIAPKVMRYVRTVSADEE